MRPVDRGPAPRDYIHYDDAKSDLVARLGLFCCYCERPIKTLLAVEHILPKSLHPNLEREWMNFLLACTNCNSTKGDRPVDRAEVILPDQDHSIRAFEYVSSGAIKATATLGPAIEEKSKRTLWLTGLDKLPTDLHEEAEFQAALERWQQRLLAWKAAKRALERIHSNDSEVLRATVADFAHATGFFSVWMTVFADDADMRRRFIEIFPGTARDCFDPVTTESLSRSGGHC